MVKKITTFSRASDFSLKTNKYYENIILSEETLSSSASLVSASASAIDSGSTNYLSGLKGEIFYTQNTASNLTLALAEMNREADATFVSKNINYGQTSGTIDSFLGGDSQSLDNDTAGDRGDLFAIRLSGQIYLEAGRHRFYNTSDDGFRLTINNEVVAEYDSPRSTGTTRGTIRISESGYYDITIEYFEQYGDATLQISHSYNFGPAQYLDESILRHSADEVVDDPVEPNQAPIAIDDSAAFNEDGAVTINLLGNDSDPDGDSLSLLELGSAAHGTIINNGDGTVTYTPDENFHGVDSFTYTISDGNGGTDTASVNLTVQSVNDAPVANDDGSYAAIAGEMIMISLSDLLANDSDLDSDTLNITGISNVTNGSAMLMSGMVHFTGTAEGAASFNYTVSDGNGGTDTATVSLNISAAPVDEPDDPPVDTGDDYSVGLLGEIFFADSIGHIDVATSIATGTPVATFTSTSVNYNQTTGSINTFLGVDAGSLSNAASGTRSDDFVVKLSGQIYLEAGIHSFLNTTDDGFRLTVNNQVIAEYADPRATGTTQGSIEISESGYYDIRIDYFEDGGDSTLEVRHSYNGSTAELLGADRTRYASGDVIDDPVDTNDAPVAVDDSGFTGTAGEMVMINLSDLLANDSDADGDTLSITGINNVVNGSAMLMGGMVHFTGTAEGAASFNYTVSDGNGGTDMATVSLNISAAPVDEPDDPPVDTNDAPVAADDSGFTGTAGEMIMISLSDLLANDSDPDGDDLTISSISALVNGSAMLMGGMIHFTGTAEGAASFNYTVSDGNGGTDTATVSLNIAAAPVDEPDDPPVDTNDAPVAVNDSGFMGEAGEMIMINVADLLANDSDADGDTLSITGISNVTNGSAMLMGGMIHFTGTAEGNGGFSYTVSDGNGGTDTANVSVMVHAPSDTGGDDGGHDHGGGDDLIDPPQTPAEIAAFVQSVINAPEHIHDGPPAAMAHMEHLYNLVPRGDATHIAINHGDWNDPSTWHNGQVPGDDAQVLIPQGIAVTYSEVNDASIFTLRVDGHLHFATDQDSRLEVDTFVVSDTGHLVIGTEDNPVDPDVNIDIVFPDNGDIDTGWDPILLSRGLISHGSVDIHGLEKTSHLKVLSDPMAGDTQITLAEVPEGWQVGDKIVLTGTYQQGWYWDGSGMAFAESQDEEVYITAINGDTITLDRALTYNHDTPRDDLKAYVANMTRNITFSSENGEDTPVHHRGHVMFMHNDDVDVQYAGFNDLGRTDKSVDSFSVDPTNPGDLAADANIRTRYSFHFHETGVSDLENPAIAIGNVVDGSPGWGFVHHSSNANFTDNVAFDVFGAAFVAEDGNETGIWYHNIAIKTEGVAAGVYAVKEQEVTNDLGNSGDGFFFAGRLVEASENVAANTSQGYVWLHRGDRDMVDPDTTHFEELGYGLDGVFHDKYPIQGFHDNEAFGTNTGIVVVKANADQGHDVRTIMDGFLNWETREGLNVSYTSHYTFLNFDILAQRPEADAEPIMNDAYYGVYFGTGAFDMVVNGIRVEGFDVAFDLTDNNSVEDHLPGDGFHMTVIDAEMINNGNEVRESFGGQLAFLTSDDLTPDQLSFLFTGDSVISENDNIFFDGLKTDSIGTVDRNFDIEQQGIWGWYKEAFLNEEGYYSLADGTNVILVEDFIADRATGDLMKYTLVFELDYADWQLNNLSPDAYRGEITLGGPMVVTQDDFAVTGVNQDIYLDLVANDYDPDGGLAYVDGLIDPRHGDVYLQDDGTVLYRANLDFHGVDTFTYWAADQEANFTKAYATVVVSDSTDMLYGTSAVDTFDINNLGDTISVVHNFSGADRLDISDILEGYDALGDSLEQFVKAEQTAAGHTILSANSDGNPAGDFEVFALLVDTSTTLDDIADQIIV